MKLTKNTLLLKGPHPLKNEYKESLRLTECQKDIIVGTLLGDAHLEKRGSKTPVYRYYFSQKEAKQLYVQHIYSHFIDWCSTEPKFAMSGTDKNSEITKFLYFRTCTHTSLTFYANQYYSEGKKVVPELIHKWLNPRVLAYWFMDDGCKNISGYVLNTQSFSLKEQEILADALGRKFKFEVNIHKDRENYRLYITANSRDSFANIVKPFILPYFEYKLF